MSTKSISISVLALAVCLALPRLANGQACGNVSSIGCCESDTVSKYCSGNPPTLKTKDCTTDPNYKFCGWYSGKYQCTTDATLVDLSGKYPRLCSALPDGGPIPVPDKGVKADTGPKADATKIPCGNIGYTGCCQDTTHASYCTTSGSLSTKACSGTKPKCGWVATQTTGYGCYACYTCVETAFPDKDPNNKYPQMCSALPDGGIPDPDRGAKDKGATTTDGATVPCGTITAKGCCDGETVKYCASGALRKTDCTATGKPKCGWDSAKSFYTCGTAGDEDPTKANPKVCAVQPTTDAAQPGVDISTTKKDTGTTTPPKKDGGCSCTVGSGATQGLLALAALLVVGVLLGLRRRRR